MCTQLLRLSLVFAVLGYAWQQQAVSQEPQSLQPPSQPADAGREPGPASALQSTEQSRGLDPVDPAVVTSLTVDQARRLTSGLEGDVLSLPLLKSLAPDVAAALTGFQGEELSFGSLPDLAPKTARALLGFKGRLELLGLRDLSPETARVLSKAENALFLPPALRLSPDARLALSENIGSIFLGKINLPQLYPADEGWRAESNTGIDKRNATRLIEQAITAALAPESTGDCPTALGGLALQTNLDDLAGQVRGYYEGDPRRLSVTSPDPDSIDVLCVRVDSTSGRVIEVEQVFHGASVQQVTGAVVEQFGRTPQVIERVTELGGPTQYATVRYTFPETLVRLSITMHPGTPIPPGFAMSLTDREWVTQNLRSYGNAVLRSCDWVSDAMRTFDGKAFDIKRLRVLPGTTREEVPDLQHVLFVDENREAMIAAARAATKGIDGYEIGITSLVGGVGVVGNRAIIVVSPWNSTVAGFKPLAAYDQAMFTTNLLGCRCQDTAKHVARHLVQQEFAPVGEIKAITGPVPGDNPGGTGDVGAGKLNQHLCNFYGWRYEWESENGWTACVSFFGDLIFFRDLEE